MRSQLTGTTLAGLACLSPLIGHTALASGDGSSAPSLWLAVQAAILVLLATRAGRSSTSRCLLVGLLVGAAIVAAFATRGLIVATTALAHAALYLTLLVWFARSLAEREDVITQLARKLKGSLSPEMAAYARRVTKLWCAFFAMQIVISAGLLAFAPLPAWSFFVNILDLPMVVAVFTAEYLYRIHRFGGAGHAGLRETMRAFWRPQSEGA